MLLAELCVHAPGQSIEPGSISGTVFDSSGQPLADARVSVIQRATGAALSAVTGADGRYAFHALTPGSYRVTVRSVLALSATADVTIEAGRSAELPMRLADVPRPIPPLRPENMVLLNADVEGPQPAGGAVGFEVAGLRAQSNNLLLDGLDNNEIWTRSAATGVPSDSVEAVTLSAGYMPAEFGHSTGGTLAVSTRSGTDQFHGDAFEYFDNSVLNARDFFDGAKPVVVENQFGASAGGRIRRNWFFFLDAEAPRDHDGMTVISTVPTAAEKAGIFSTPIYDPATLYTPGDNILLRLPFAGNQIPAARIPQASENVLSLYPNANLPGSADNFRFSPFATTRDDQFLARSDARLSSRSAIFVRFNMDRPDQLSPAALPGGGSDFTQNADDETTRARAWSAGVSHNFTFRPSLINEFRAGASVVDLSATANDQGVNASSLLGIPGLSDNGLPSIDLTGYASLGAYGPAPFAIRTLSAEIDDNVSWITHRHAFKFGFQAIRRHADGDASQQPDRGTFLFTPDYTSLPGTATGNSIASLLLSYPDEVLRDVQLDNYHVRSWEWSAFAQDQFRISDRLTFEAGIRYSFYPPPTDASGDMINFNFSRVVPELSSSAPMPGAAHAFAPRAGFALNLARDGSTLLRGGFSSNYDSGAYLTEASLARNAPFASRYDLLNGSFYLGPSITAGLPPAVAISPTTTNLNSTSTPIYGIQPVSFTPYADEWNVFLEHRLPAHLVFQMGVTSSMGIHLFAAYNANQPYPGPYSSTDYPDPYSPYEGRINYLGFGGGSTYYGGVTRIAGQVRPGLVLFLNYAFSKSIDDSAAPGTDPQGRPPFPQNIYNARANRSLSAFDVQQRAVLAAEYSVPLEQQIFAHWRVSTLITLQSGLPFTPQLATNTLNDGGFQLPDRVANGASSSPSYLQWFDTSAFVIPALYQFGNSGMDILRGPALETADVSLARTFAVWERVTLQFRVDEFNLLNRVNFGLPERILDVPSTGMIDHTVTPGRQSRVSLRLGW